jgi:hypothetical protein
MEYFLVEKIGRLVQEAVHNHLTLLHEQHFLADKFKFHFSFEMLYIYRYKNNVLLPIPIIIVVTILLLKTRAWMYSLLCLPFPIKVPIIQADSFRVL